MVPVNQPPRNFTHGEIVRWRRIGGLLLAEVRYAPGQRIARHAHPHARFVLVLSGSLAEVRGGATETYQSSTLLFRHGLEPHAYVVSETGATCLIADVDEAWVARARQHARLLTESTAFRGGYVIHLAHRMYGEFRQRDEVSRLMLESVALGVLAEASRSVARAARPAPAWLARARALVERHFAEPLPLRTVAGHVGVHPVHLARTFRRVYQTTVAAYVRQVRVEFARRELVLSAASLSEIAAAAGFCDQSHLSRCFKQHTGLTPAEYRLARHAR
jgi:AraC family transcriptional regulator